MDKTPRPGHIYFSAYGQTVEMVCTTIDDQTNWNDYTIDQALAVVTAAQEMLPSNILNIYKLLYREQSERIKSQRENLIKSITEEQRIRILPEFHGKCIEILSDIKPETLERMNRIERKIIFDRYIEVAFMGMMLHPDYEAREIECFEHEGQTYWLPPTTTGYNDMKVPMGDDTTAIEFTEAVDLEMKSAGMKGGRWNLAPLTIAILCRPKKNGKREPYDKMIAMERANKFKSLPLSTAFDVFFCFIERLHTSNESTLRYLRAAGVSPEDGLGFMDGVIPSHQ